MRDPQEEWGGGPLVYGRGGAWGINIAVGIDLWTPQKERGGGSAPPPGMWRFRLGVTLCDSPTPHLGRPANHSATVRRPFPLSHGTTTVGFIFQGGAIVAADTRASAGGLVVCPAIHKITPIHSHLMVTSSGSAADYMQWERILAKEI
ncbi:Proteasome subunit beta type-11 [Liparis tanakae]|uniref:Proteasome subunit beta type-11 n=1 Tax=Liparis tanakae TaxID=230148 RepID=A0A4Z2FQK4_9TELE|nr:Proteasome subunit beta type-11 [Liparis tanakae]